MQQLSEILSDLEARGFRALHLESGRLRDDGGEIQSDDIQLLDTIATDCGTDPGDDATIYLLRAGTGLQGYLMLPDGAHADPAKARFVDRLMRRSAAQARNKT
jgi:hypothetical protein